MEKLVLIDGNSLINRAFYAMPLLTTKSGVYTNAVLGFMNMYLKMLSDEKPTKVVVAFDRKAPTFRHEMYSEYKGTRKPMPLELVSQLPILKDILKLMGVCMVERDGIEADDIIGTIAKSTKIPTIIYTGDKDSFQLVDEETSVYFTRRGLTDLDVYTKGNFTEKTGLIPSQIIELKALMGDSSDNIPGVSGVGEKTALNLLQNYSNLDGVYAHIEEIKGKLKEKLIAEKEVAYLSKTLATINTECELNLDIESTNIKEKFSSEVRAKFIELEFKSLYNKESLFEETQLKNNQSDTLKSSIEIILKTEVDLNFEKRVLESENLTVVFTGEKVCVYNCNDFELQYKLRGNLLDDGIDYSAIREFLRAIFSSNKTLYVYDKKSIRHYLKQNLDIEFTSYANDISLIKYVVDYTGKDFSALNVIVEYGISEDVSASALYKVYTELENKFDDYTTKLYKDIELPLSDLLYEMEVAGFKVDAVALNEAGKKYQEILDGLAKEIKELADEPELNVNSPKQIGEILFEKLKLGKAKKNRKGYSTTADILEGIEDKHPIVPLILKHRKIQKLVSTYIDGFKPLIDKKTGLIHTSFNQTVTATGRLSSKEPNLQNIPVRDDEGKELRKFFVPKSNDRVLIGADYSQIELRLLSAFSGCQSLIDAFRNGVDIHTATASKVFKVDEKDVTAHMRRSAKAVNFGIIYGISEYGLAKNLKIGNAEAREYIKNYFIEYPEVKEYMNKNVEFAKEKGYAETLFGRKRYIRELLSSNFNLRAFGERVAMNMPLQGSAADIIKVAMINVANRLKKEKLKSELILQIHDELIIDAFISEQEEVKRLLKEEMENAVDLAVKLTVEVGVGNTWYDAK